LHWLIARTNARTAVRLASGECHWTGTLRGSLALWIAAGASPKEIAARAGHTSVVTVLDRYGHLLPGSEDKVNAALDALADAAAPTTDAAVVPLVR
jgi:integrase